MKPLDQTSNSTAVPDFGPERREFERVPVAIFGRCMFQNKLEIPCQAINISPGDLAAVAAHTPEMGETVIIYLDNIGRVEGQVARLFEGGFAMRINGTERMREKLASKIAWYKEHAKFGIEDKRSYDRMEPLQPIGQIQLDDGRTYPIEIIDISLTGAAIKCEVRPAMGSKLTLGGMQGVVVRHFTEGLAIEFLTEQSIDTLKNQFL